MGDTPRERERGVVPAGYQVLLSALKERIRAAQVRAALSINRELITLYWQVGRDILAQQQEHGWGAQVIDRLAADLRHAFPTMKGFSRRNLHYMRAFAEALCWLVRPSVRLAAGPDWLTRHADRDDAARPRQVWRGSALWSPARPAPPPPAPAARCLDVAARH